MHLAVSGVTDVALFLCLRAATDVGETEMDTVDYVKPTDVALAKIGRAHV